MCGIAGFHSLDGRPVDQAGRLADSLLIGIENRGRDATGLLAVSAADQHLQKLVLPASKFIKYRDRFQSDARTVLLHTRFATTGERTATRDAHPQVSGRLAAIHNGTVYNADQLFETFKLDRKNKVDSEIIPALVGYAGWDKAEQALKLMQGGAATAIVNYDEPGQVILARLRHYPLVYAEMRGLVVWASTRFALKAAVDFVYDLKLADSQIVEMVPGEVARLNGKITKSTIPGVYGVETDKPWGTIGKSTKKAKAASKAKDTSRPPRVRVTQLSELGKAWTSKTKAVKPAKRELSKGEKELLARASRKGSFNTVGEITRLLDELAAVREKAATLEKENKDLEQWLAEETEENDTLREELEVAEELFGLGSYTVEEVS